MIMMQISVVLTASKMVICAPVIWSQVNEAAVIIWLATAAAIGQGPGVGDKEVRVVRDGEGFVLVGEWGGTRDRYLQ